MRGALVAKCCLLAAISITYFILEPSRQDLVVILGLLSALSIGCEVFIQKRLYYKVVQADVQNSVTYTPFGVQARSRALRCIRTPFILRLGILYAIQILFIVTLRSADHSLFKLRGTDVFGEKSTIYQADEITGKQASERLYGGIKKGGVEDEKAATRTTTRTTSKTTSKITSRTTSKMPTSRTTSKMPTSRTTSKMPTTRTTSKTTSPSTTPRTVAKDPDIEGLEHSDVVWVDRLEHKPLTRRMKTMSVVLPCAGEGEFARKTVDSVFNSMPQEKLLEIVVVDDGSDPPLANTDLDEEFCRAHKVKIIRHNEGVGLIGAKQDGGDQAKGDIIIFFDCHVAPQPNWYQKFFDEISENYRRIMIPQITGLDVNTWTQKTRGGVAKCYVTFDGDFKWVKSDDDWVPTLSGGLLGISKEWWHETGGYDVHMRGWGGENIDQSMRTWLCGGEMKMAVGSEVAHMWRIASEPKTQKKYSVPPGSRNKNIMRAVTAWFGDFGRKAKMEYPVGQGTNYGDISNIKAISDKLNCKPFAWFLWKFRKIYVDGGIIPIHTFNLKSEGKCLRYARQAGTSRDGRGELRLVPCNTDDHRQRFHEANKNLQAGSGGDNDFPFSGLRAWNTDQCMNSVENGEIKTFVCEVSGSSRTQNWRLEGGKLHVKNSASCVSVVQSNHVEMKSCDGTTVWEMIDVREPMETRYYKHALKTQPDLFKD